MPNPITPNYDNINDFCQFIYPGMNDYPASIHIFNLTGREIREINVPVCDNAAKYSTWDGLDDNGCSLPPGIYIYLIDSNGQIVCNGTVTIAR
jgi:gliding motility-associated-like protein